MKNYTLIRYNKLLLASLKVFWEDGEFDILKLVQLSRSRSNMPTKSDFDKLINVIKNHECELNK